jgi:hypothetical protein
MSTVAGFNSMMGQFLEELAGVFPDVPEISQFKDLYPALTAANARKPLEVFMAAAGPVQDRVMAKDASAFGELRLGSIDFAQLWASEGLTQSTRDAIWQYLHMLLLLGSTVLSVPPELLNSIESVANSCADKITSGDMDFSAVTQMLMGGGGGGGLGALAGLMGGAGGAGGLDLARMLGGGGASD